MKSRDNYIIDTAHSYMPYVDYDVDKAINYASALYDRMKQRGIGSKESKPAPLGKEYSKLNESQRVRFDKFWLAWRHPKNKQGAARSWLKLEKEGEINNSFDLILIEAKKFSDNRGESTQQAQGWLNKMMYADGVIETEKPVMSEEERILRQDLAHAKSELDKCEITFDLDYWESEVKRLTKQLEQIGSK